MSLEYIVNGVAYSADQLLSTAPKRKAKPPNMDGYHKGWRVEGHPPGAVEFAEQQRQKEIARWNAMGQSEQGHARSRGEREPKPWDREKWLRETKKRAVRSKPYELPQAAQECKQMAEKAGWICVTVSEVKREVQSS